MVQYNVALTITEAIKGTSKEKKLPILFPEIVIISKQISALYCL